MIPIATFQGKDVAVFGLGRSGLSTCRALIAGGARVHAWDDGEAGRSAAQKAGFTLVDLRNIDWSALDALVLAPGVPLTHPKPHWTVELASAAGVEVIGDVELFARARAASCPAAPFIAITGTNGKSTTTALIAHMLMSAGRDTQMGGNIGVPILDLEPPALERVHVIELSSYQIDLMPGLQPSIGMVLNVSPDHLDRHGGFANYAAIKARVAAMAELVIIGGDDETTRMIAEQLIAEGRHVVMISGERVPDGFGVESGLVQQWSTQDARAGEPIADINGIVSLRGTHNAQNAAAAAAAGRALGLSNNEIADGLKTFPGLPHRMEELGRQGNVIFINDSKATNAESTANALAAFERDIHWIAGGLAKDGGIESLAPYFSRITKAYLIGTAAEDFSKTLDTHCRIQCFDTLQAATEMAAFDAANAGNRAAPIILLSPACASFDQFASFEVRGDAFREIVSGLPGIVLRGGAK